MTRLFFFPALLALLLLFGCNEDRVFMTPSDEVDVVDVTDKDIFFNGELVGNVEKDIVENEEKNQYKITPLNNILEKRAINSIEKGIMITQSSVHIRISTNLLYKVLCRVSGQSLWWDRAEVVLEDDFKSPFLMIRDKGMSVVSKKDGSKIDNPCLGLPRGIRRAKEKMVKKEIRERWERIGHFHGSEGEKYAELWNKIQEREIRNLERERKCAENFMEMDFYIGEKDGKLDYSLALNESEAVDGFKEHKFQSDEYLWKFLDDLKLNKKLEYKLDRDEVMFVAPGDSTIKNFTPYISQFAKLGYKIGFVVNYH